MAMMSWPAAVLVGALSAQAPDRIECFADRAMVFQRGTLTQTAEQRGTQIVMYRVDRRGEIETLLSADLGKDQARASARVEQRLAEHPEWLEQLTHSALGQSRALALGIARYPAIAIDGRVYYTDHIDEALKHDAEISDDR